METRAVNALLERLKGGDKQAVGELYEGMARELYCFVLPMSANPEHAWDTVHDAFIRAMQGVQSFSAGNGRAWMYQIAKNLCYNSTARMRFEQPGLPRTEDAADGQFDGVHADMLLSQLEPHERQLVHLKVLCGFTFKEISIITGDAAHVLKRRLRRALLQLKKILSN